MDCGPISLWPFGSTSQTESPSIITFCLGFALDLAHKGLVVPGNHLAADEQVGEELGLVLMRGEFGNADKDSQRRKARKLFLRAKWLV